MPNIVLSYRRQDSEAIAGRIRDRLAGHYGADSVFMDIDNIPYGFDFRAQIQEALRRTDVLVAVIGPKWTGAGRGRLARIREDNDPVRIEVERALGGGIPVVPVLVNGARMPKPTDLPDSIRDFSYRHAAEVDSGRDFHQHMDRLIRSIDQILQGASGSSGAPEAATAEDSLTTAGALETVPEAEVEDRLALPSNLTAEPIPEAKGTGHPSALSGPDDGTALAADTADTSTPQGVTVRLLRRRGMKLAFIVALCVLSAGTGYVYLRRADLRPLNISATKELNETPASSQNIATIDTSCKPSGAAAFYDDFKSPDGGWGQGDDARSFKDGRMLLSPKVNESKSWIYFPLLFKNAVICSEVVSPPEIKDAEGVAAGGVIFWAIDYEHYYVAEIFTNGSYGIWRRAAGNWLEVVPRAPAASLRSGPNAVNQLKIATGSTRAAVSINGTKAVEFWGQPPGRGGAVGLYGQSGDNTALEWRFSSIAVVDADKETTPSAQALNTPQATAFLDACKPNGTVAFFDGFVSPDPGWGPPTNTDFFKDGQMKLKPRLSSSSSWIFAPMIFKSGIVCAEIKSPAQIDNSSGSGGVIFWASDISNYYLSSFFVDGTFAIFRKIDGRWAMVRSRTKAASLAQGANGVNRVKVTFANDHATVTVNNVDIVQLSRVQPPEGGGAVGFYAESGDNQQEEWSLLNIAVMENPNAGPVVATSTPAENPCKTSSPATFFDDFAPPDPGWGPASQTAYFENSQLVLKPKANGAAWWIYTPIVFENAKICSEIHSPHQIDKAEDNAEGGLVFWAADYQNFYSALIYTDGTYSIWRKLAGKWIEVVPRAKADSIRAGPDAVNKVTVATVGHIASLMVNDVKLVNIWGQSPSKGGAVGFYAESESGRENHWLFSSITVVEEEHLELKYPEVAQVAANACKSKSVPAFFDNFTAPNPGWGKVGATYFFKDGQMVLKPKAPAPESWIFAPLTFSEATICSELKFPSQPRAESDGAAGVIFWAADYNNYYLAEIGLDGSYSVFRKINGEWATVIPNTPAKAIHQGGDAVNRLKVVLDRSVATIVINDATMVGFHGQPADISGAVGLYAQSGNASDIEWRFTNLVVTN